MIQDIMIRQGSWFFRWRSYVLLAFAPIILWTIASPEPIETYLGGFADDFYEGMCIVLAFGGFAIRAATVGFVPGGTSGRNTRRQLADALNTTGMYSLTRNPLYLGNALTILGITAFTQSLSLVLIMLLFLIVYLERIIAAEEAFLTQKFGDIYRNWAAEVPAFFPRWTGWKPPVLRFSIRTVLKREHSTLMSVILPLFIIETLRDYFVEGEAPQAGWIAAVTVCLLAYVVLISLKKRTQLLDVDGR